MSASYVRTLVRTWAANAATATSIPYFDTVNLEQNPQDPLWWTIEFDFAFAEKLTYCNDWQEEGSIDVIVLGRPGVGDVAVIEAAEKIRDSLLGEKDATDKLKITGNGAPEEYSDGSGEDRWYQAIVSLEYIANL